MRRRGFTLIEMCVVITILAMMAALIVPNLVALKRSRDVLDAEAALLRLPDRARAEARKSKTTVSLRVEGDAVVMERTPLEEDPVEITRLTSPQLTFSVSTDWIWNVRADGTADRATLEVMEGSNAKTMLLPPDGEPRFLTADEADQESPENEKWSAGELEVRTETTQ
ncbi:MAG: type II secretion system protein [Armatimonas sp.]